MHGSAKLFPVSKKIMFNFVKWVANTGYYFDTESLKWLNVFDESELTDVEIFKIFLDLQD